MQSTYDYFLSSIQAILTMQIRGHCQHKRDIHEIAGGEIYLPEAIGKNAI